MVEVDEKRIAELSKQVQAKLSERRFEHCLRVKDYAIKLAKQNGLDENQAAIAGLVHDYAKERSASDFEKEIDEKHLDSDLKKWGNPIWHGVVGAYFVQDELGIQDPEILEAIKEHTTGDNHDKMSTLSKVLFMADYLEMGRNFPGVEKARTLTDESLDAGVFYQLSATLSYLAGQQKPIYPKTFTAYNDWATYLAK
ncbi:bis(5'-nucleosyl)-tetraphosphatase (symmetrical) YqeK [Fructobacillus sp. W13]|uniref:bis(5'-nucleosyl)-tetraphosphatase (symmetrical) n=1 Tax=Fructobacillus apis TaxID=2935017 RepID=A0ABT0ZRL0_9LACO|nr:bis(5'-nucleosyl)-tetraphosphatase (symmetrical) YqeK [Fructobacillus apis]MCO0832630.1 bis(5'-nucleosyl)-tetraphosphatase (symmetrical) YqeK [Fructobacillus apis]